jgi:hypothetical protein
MLQGQMPDLKILAPRIRIQAFYLYSFEYPMLKKIQ